MKRLSPVAQDQSYRTSEILRWIICRDPKRSKSSRLVKLQKIEDVDVEVVQHTTLNITKGVVASRTEQEMTTEFALQGVIV